MYRVLGGNKNSAKPQRRTAWWRRERCHGEALRGWEKRVQLDLKLGQYLSVGPNVRNGNTIGCSAVVCLAPLVKMPRPLFLVQTTRLIRDLGKVLSSRPPRPMWWCLLSELAAREKMGARGQGKEGPASISLWAPQFYRAAGTGKQAFKIKGRYDVRSLLVLSAFRQPQPVRVPLHNQDDWRIGALTLSGVPASPN